MTTTLLDHPDAPAPSTTQPRSPKVRDGFLDTVRAIALIRVIIWHTLAAVAISWFVASMPAMFFVAGSLLARSLDKRPWRELLRGRLHRLLLPFWTFSAVVVVVLIAVHQFDPSPATALSPLSLVAWIFPIIDPHGSAWEAGWASTPLWYLRCYLWLLLLSPLLRRAHRRLGLKVLFFPIAAVFIVDYLMRHPELAPSAFTAVKYYAGDLATFSFFWMLGFSHSDGALAQLTRRAHLEWAVIGGASALVWVKFIAPPTLVVNDSYPLLLFVGIGWLGIFLAGEHWIGRATLNRFTGPIVRWLGRRSITVYLWHPIAIVGAYWLRATVAPTLPRVAVLPAVFALVIVLSVLFGRVEDYAAGRAAQWWPGRDDGRSARDLGARLNKLVPRRISPVRGMVVGVVVGAVVLGVLIPSPTSGTSSAAAEPSAAGGLALPPAPSAKPDQADFGDTGSSPDAAGTTAAAAGTDQGATAATSVGAAPAAASAGAAGPVDQAAVQQKLQAAVDAWRTAKVVDGVELGVMTADGTEILVSSGTSNGAAWDLSKAYPITSVTKSMTAAITLQLVKEGKIGLDDMLPEITAVPGLPYVGKVTIRQILNHTAGILPYDTSPAYQAAKSGPLTPESALQLIIDQPLEWTPGEKVGYSNSGYLTLGLLDAQLSGTPYPELLQKRVFDAAGMAQSVLNDTPSAGWSGFSAGGVESTISDQLAYGDALYRKSKILDPGSLADMLDIDNQFNTGLGSFPTCPCSTENGAKVYASIGHNGGQTSIQYAPKQNLVIALNLTESLWTNDLKQSDVAELLTAVETAAS